MQIQKTIFLLVIPFLICSGKTKPYTISDCIDYAHRNSPTLKKELLNSEDAMLNHVIAKATLAFGVNYASSYTLGAEKQGNDLTLTKKFIDGSTVSVGGNLDNEFDDDSDSSSVSVKISKQILGGGGWLETSNAIDDTFIDQTIALNKISKAKRNIGFQVKRSFYNLIRDYQSLSIQERRLERAKKNLEHAIEREKPQDIITAQIEIPENELALVRAKSGIEQKLDSLKSLIGMPMSEEISIDTAFEYKIFNTDLERDMNFSINQHEDFLNNQLEITKLQADQVVSKQNILPDVSLSATHTDKSMGDGFNLKGEDEQIISLDFSWQLGSTTDIAKYKKKLNEIRNTEIDLYILTQEKSRKLKDLHRKLLQTEQSIELQDQRVSFTEKQVALFQDRWANGEIDILELVRSQNSLEDAKVNLINLKAEYLDLVAEYKFEVGRE